MGLFKRHMFWWMTFMYQGQQVRRSTETTDKRLAEAIFGKVKVQIIEGRFFEKQEAQHRTLKELMDRYATEHAARRANHRRELTSIKNLKTFFGNPTLDQITPKRIVAYKNQRYTDGVKPATINRELATLKKAFNLARREWEWCTDNPVCRVSMEREQHPGSLADRGRRTAASRWCGSLAAGARGLCHLYRHAHGGDPGPHLGRCRSVPSNGHRLSIKKRRATDDPSEHHRS